MFDIAVVGGGMVGASLALKLSQAGLKVALLEKQPQQQLDSSVIDLRVSAINLRSEAWLSTLGAWQQLPTARICTFQQLTAFEADAAPLDFTAAELGVAHLGHIVENNQLQQALWQQFPSQLQLFCPATVTGLTQQSAYAAVQTAEHGEIQARLVIAADGAQSQLRQLAGIGVTGWQYQQACLVIHVQTAYPHLDCTWQQFTEQGPRAYLPLPGDEASLVWYDNIHRVKQLAALSPIALEAEIQQYFPARLGSVKVLKQSWFPLARSHANQYVMQRLVLVGDAAHSINPLAGQGVNLGFADAELLAELLISANAAGLDMADSRSLQQYETERRRANALMMAAMDGFYQLFGSRWPLLRLARKVGLQLALRAGPLKTLVGRYAAGIQ